ncbi:MAG: nucleotidyltransferase domain-containing protein [Nanoarchaeota archaeon]|nr:nucleotidyltransferase domain-containing protein [Nanoarchaeota archaeon]
MNLLNKMMGHFMRDISAGYYASQIAHALRINQKTVSNYLNSLEKQHLLKSRSEGKNKVFFFNRDEPLLTKSFLIQIESEKTTAFFQTHFNIMSIMERIPGDCVIIFGSYAKGLEKKDSDLDLLIVGKTDDKAIKDLEKIYHIEINVHRVDERGFISAMKNREILINEVVKDHIIIRGLDLFIHHLTESYHRHLLLGV